MNHEKFMQMAIDLAEYNVKEGQGGPFGRQRLRAIASVRIVIRGDMG